MGADFDKSKGRKRHPTISEGDIETSSLLTVPPLSGVNGFSLPPGLLPSSPSKTQNYGNAPAPVVEVEDISTFVTNIVYCRDPKVLSKLEESSRNMTQPGYYNLRLLIQHENFLDVKQLIRTTNMVSECERYESNRMKQKKKVGGGIKVGNDTDALVQQLSDGSRTLLFESRFESGNLFLA